MHALLRGTGVLVAKAHLCGTDSLTALHVSVAAIVVRTNLNASSGRRPSASLRLVPDGVNIENTGKRGESDSFVCR